jgi:hypothetical protein
MFYKPPERRLETGADAFLFAFKAGARLKPLKQFLLVFGVPGIFHIDLSATIISPLSLGVNLLYEAVTTTIPIILDGGISREGTCR